MRLFKITTSDYNFGENIKHKVFLTDKEELEFRRSMDNLMQKQTIKNYEMKEVHINDIDDIRSLIGLSLADLKKLILQDAKEKNQKSTVCNKMQNENNEVRHYKDISFMQWLKPSFFGVMQYIRSKNPKLVTIQYNHDTGTMVYKYKLHGIKIPFPIDNRLKYDTTMETTKDGIVIHIYNKKIDYS